MSERLEADARIVKTVRSLQKTQPKDKNRESSADMYACLVYTTAPAVDKRGVTLGAPWII